MFQFSSTKAIVIVTSAEERPVPLGRPAKYWRLTQDADRLFPDGYAELNVALNTAVTDTFGAQGMDRLLQARLAGQKKDYAARIDQSASLAKRVQQLARVRTEEGYMAEVVPEGRAAFLLVENHCPICAAATAWQGFCSTEIDLFKAALGPAVSIERTEHILSGDRRWAYRIKTAS